jgi:hypothetical protein
MKTVITGFILAALMVSAQAVQAHEVPNISHTHAFKSAGYGKYRQGHSVNGPQGSIIIWSAQPKTGYQNQQTVRFARPKPITKAPASPSVKPAIPSTSTTRYGKEKQ